MTIRTKRTGHDGYPLAVIFLSDLDKQMMTCAKCEVVELLTAVLLPTRKLTEKKAKCDTA